MTRLWREPLLHFLVLGAMLFGLFSLVGEKQTEAPAKIIVSTARIANLATGFVRTWQRPPTEPELQGLIADYIRDEVFYREGRAAGLDRDDTIVRRRLRQKMEFMAEDLGVAEPSDEQLNAYLGSQPERFRSEDRLTFRHVFLSTSRRKDTMERDAEHVGAALAKAGASAQTAEFGDPFLLGEEFRALPRSDVARAFGERFAERLSAVEKGRWQGPIPSAFGLHFVFLDERTPGTLSPLDAVRPAVRRDWMNARRLEAEEKLYRSLRERYEIVVEAAPSVPIAKGELPGAAP